MKTMTQKEKLYKELLILKNESIKLKGNEVELDVEKYSETFEFSCNASRYTIKDLKSEIESLNNLIERLKKENAVKEWLETEEGKAYMEFRNEELKYLEEKYWSLIDKALDTTRANVRFLLGSEFDITSFCDGRMEIGLVEKYVGDKAVAYFGLDFDVFFNHEIFGDKGFRWDLNYGTNGSFKIEEDVNQTKFLVGLAKFASDTTIVPALKNLLHDFAQEAMELRHRMYKLEDEIAHPKYKTCGNYQWKYSNSNKEIVDIRTCIVQLTKKGEQICSYESVTKASASTGISRTSISNNLSNKSKSAGGFVWKKI